MVGRYVIATDRYDIYERFRIRMVPDFRFENFNAAPTQGLPVIREIGGDRELVTMRWGLVSRWKTQGTNTPSPFNARSETVLEKPMFRSLLNRHRCLVPANGYYEWKVIDGKKQPFLFTVKDQKLIAFAGIFDEFEESDGTLRGSYAILTTIPNSFAAVFHHRMPVILPRDAEATWIDVATDQGRAVEHLLRPFPAELMEARAVSPAVNDVRNNGPDLIKNGDENDTA